jgi:transcriptional regulator with XRE-family HTH domain
MPEKEGQQQLTFGLMLSDARKALGFRSQEQLAEAVGVDKDTVENWETDEAVPYSANLKALLAALTSRGLSVDERRALEQAANQEWLRRGTRSARRAPRRAVAAGGSEPPGAAPTPASEAGESRAAPPRQPEAPADRDSGSNRQTDEAPTTQRPQISVWALSTRWPVYAVGSLAVVLLIVFVLALSRGWTPGFVPASASVATPSPVAAAQPPPPEGVVHALQRFHRWLRPDGLVLDLQPEPEFINVDIVRTGRRTVRIGHITRPRSSPTSTVPERRSRP